MQLFVTVQSKNKVELSLVEAVRAVRTKFMSALTLKEKSFYVVLVD
jgi:hypothetical protein